MKIGFIGSGNMGGAIARGIVKSGVVSGKDVYLYDVLPAASAQLADDIGGTAVNTPEELTSAAELFVLAVKPVYVKDALRACCEGLAGKAVVSIVAGLSGAALAKQLPEGTRCLQTMPNTPAMVNEGVTALCEENTLTQEELDFVRRMFSAIGRVYTLPARLIEAESAVAGSGPAYAAMFIEAMADAGVAEGLPRTSAYRMAAAAVAGSARMVLETGQHPAALKDAVCSPAGTTIEGLRVLEEKGMRSAVIESLLATIEKAKRL